MVTKHISFSEHLVFELFLLSQIIFSVELHVFIYLFAMFVLLLYVQTILYRADIFFHPFPVSGPKISKKQKAVEQETNE